MGGAGYVYVFGHRISSSFTLNVVLGSAYGIGVSKRQFLLQVLNLDGSERLSELSRVTLSRLDLLGSQLGYGRELRFKDDEKFKLAFPQSSYKELRLKQGLPVNGQRTWSNSSTAKRINKYLFYRLLSLRKR